VILWVGDTSTIGYLTMSFMRASDSLCEDERDRFSDFGRECRGNVADVMPDLFSLSQLLGSPMTLGVYLTGSVLVALEKSSGSGIKISSVRKEDIAVSSDSVPVKPELR
jgi:hypothetical protein